MSYGVNTWAPQPGRARSAGSSSGKSTRTGRSKKTGSVRRARKKKPATKRRSVQKSHARSGATLDPETARILSARHPGHTYEDRNGQVWSKGQSLGFT